MSRLEAISEDEVNLLETCANCRYCATFCAVEKEDELRPLPSIIAEGLLIEANHRKTLHPAHKAKLLEDTYRCGLCGRCISCGYKLDIVASSYRLRRLLAEKELLPEPLLKLRHQIKESRNSFGADTSARGMWVDYVGLTKIRLDKAADTLYFVGCTSSYRSQGQDIAYAASLALNTIGEDWTILGADEWCCGAPLLAIGAWKEAEEHAKHNVEFIESLGVKQVVSSCPSCVNVLKQYYPRIIKRQTAFEVHHIVEVIARSLGKGALSSLKKSDLKIVYHDPCQLARTLGVLREPRQLLSRMANTILEFPESGGETRCCGAGVGDIIEVVDPAARLQAAGRRLLQAGLVGADIIISACPDCKIALSEAARRVKSGIEVLDIVELLCMQGSLI
jgi:Fe-S oxidoreductase